MAEITAELALEVSRFRSALRQANNRLSNFVKGGKKHGNDFGREMGRGITAGFAKAFAGVAAVIGAAKLGAMVGAEFKRSIVDAANIESMQVSMGVLLGDEQAGKRMIEDLRKQASELGMEFETVAEAAQKLLNYGVKGSDISGALAMLGDISGGNKQLLDQLGTVFGQVYSTGHLTGQDLLQFINAGFNPLNERSMRTGESMTDLKDMMSKGQISFADVLEEMRIATSEGGRFFGMLEKQADTLNGRFARIKSNQADIRLEFGKPVGEALKPILDFLIQRQEELKKKAGEWGEEVAKVVDIAGTMLDNMSVKEMLEMAGMALKLQIQEGMNILGRGIDAAITTMSETDGFGEMMERAAMRFHEVMLTVMAEITRAIADMMPQNRWGRAAARKMEAGADKMEEGADAARFLRQRLEDQGAPDLGKVFAENFEKATPWYDTDETRGELEDKWQKIQAQADARTMARRAKAEDTGVPGPAAEPEQAVASGGGVRSLTGASSLASAMSYFTGGSLQAEGNKLLSIIAKNTTPKPAGPPRVPGAAMGVGVFG